MQPVLTTRGIELKKKIQSIIWWYQEESVTDGRQSWCLRCSMVFTLLFQESEDCRSSSPNEETGGCCQDLLSRKFSSSISTEDVSDTCYAGLLLYVTTLRYRKWRASMVFGRLFKRRLNRSSTRFAGLLLFRFAIIIMIACRWRDWRFGRDCKILGRDCKGSEETVKTFLKQKRKQWLAWCCRQMLFDATLVLVLREENCRRQLPDLLHDFLFLFLMEEQISLPILDRRADFSSVTIHLTASG